MGSLVAVLFPGVAMAALLALPEAGAGTQGLPQLWQPAGWPVQLWIVAVSGTVGTVCGVLDWRFHRRGGRRISRAEHRAELCALGLGAPLFLLLVTASASDAPGPLLVPIVAVALVMAGLIAYDETRFHRACGPYETLLHRLLVGGNGIAFLAWLHWCFCRGVSGV